MTTKQNLARKLRRNFEIVLVQEFHDHHGSLRTTYESDISPEN